MLLLSVHSFAPGYTSICGVLLAPAWCDNLTVPLSLFLSAPCAVCTCIRFSYFSCVIIHKFHERDLDLSLCPEYVGTRTL